MRIPRLAVAIHNLFRATWFKETLLALPRIGMLLPKLISDRRVPFQTKAALIGLLVYITSPWDIIPDFIPGLGQLDDVVVVLLLFEGILNQVDDKVIVEHWTGEIATLRRIQEFSRSLAHWTPHQVRDFLFGKAVSAGEMH